MPTFLEMSREVHKLAQVQGSLSSVLDPGINGEIALLVSRAWVEIQNLRNNFLFMRKTAGFTAAIGESTYQLSTIFPNPLTEDFGRWVEEPRSVYLTPPSTGKTFDIPFTNYDSLRHRMKLYSADPNSTPMAWSFDTATLAFVMWPKPEEAYVVSADYYRSAQILLNNQDVPHIRSSWHDMIVSKATSDFAAAKSIPGLHQMHNLRYAQRVGDLYRAFVPSESVTIRPAA